MTINRRLRIAVSGVGGASGQSIIQSLMASTYLSVDVLPVDVRADSPGLYMGNRAGTVLPKPEENVEAWVDFVNRFHIDALIPGADRDLLPLSKYAKETKAIVSRPEVIRVAHDKLETAIVLAGAGITVPVYALPQSEYIWKEFPCVVKPRSDAASRGFHICTNEDELHFHLKHTTDAMIQQYIPGSEYTCNVFCNRDGVPVARMHMKRVEKGGIAVQATPVANKSLDALLDHIGSLLKPMGTLSVQLKWWKDSAYPFEINARCSGSTIVRALAGYDDPEMLIRFHDVLRVPKDELL